MSKKILGVSQVNAKYNLPKTSLEDAINFASNKNIVVKGFELLHDPCIQEQINEKHLKKNRCFMFASIIPNEKGELIIHTKQIISLEDISKVPYVKDDKRFIEYVQKYDIEIMLPIYFKSTGNQFQASIVMLPWADPNKIKEALNLNTK